MRNWKKSFRKLPTSLQKKLDSIDGEFIKVASAKVITRQQLQSDDYSHLNLSSTTVSEGFSTQFLPTSDIGKTSKKNREGWEVIRDDLPKYTKVFYREIPNFGDASRNGWSTVAIPREVYERDTYPPYLFYIKLYVEKIENDKITFLFEISEPCSRKSPSFEDDLLFAVNLLQENIGVSNILSSDESSSSLTNSLKWDVFPPGNIDEVMRKLISSKSNSKTDIDEAALRERLILFDEFEPVEFLRGLGGNSHYIGARYADDLVVFESIRQGNALYVLYEDWEELSKKSRRELLRLNTKNFDRIIHNEGWKHIFAKLLTTELKARGITPNTGRRIWRYKRRDS